MKLDIDFENSTANFYANFEAVDLYNGMQWLLKAFMHSICCIEAIDRPLCILFIVVYCKHLVLL